MAILMWQIHNIRATVLRSKADLHSKIEIPVEMNPYEVTVWFFEMLDNVTKEDLGRFCYDMEVASCHLVTSGNFKKLVRVSGSYSMVLVLEGSFYDLIVSVTPDFELLLIPDNEDNLAQQPPAFLQPGAATWGLNRIGADQKDTFGAGVTIFVLDTGVRTTHNDFTGRASPGADMSSGSLEECSGNLNCAEDRQGHGTHCAGTAAGSTYGVATSAQLQSVKVLSDQGSGSWSWSFAVLDWLATSAVRPAVASMSLGGSGTSSAMKDAVDAAISGGVVVVVAAGNENSDACGFSPAYVPNAITVGSTVSTDARSGFSNYGTCVDIWAPGSSVLSLSHTSNTGTSTKSGTSMACPHVSGAAALILGVDGSKSPQQVISDLLDDARRNEISGLRTGDTNALLYVGAGEAPNPVPTPAPPPGSWMVSGKGCTLSGHCVQSNGHPGNYDNDQSCSLEVSAVPLRVDAFDTERGYDILTMSDGVAYSGTKGPPSGTYSGTISWNSDYSVTRSGWQLCRTDGTGSSPTPSPTPAPTPAPSEPSPSTPAPTPTTGNCNSWCEPPDDCDDYPYSCSGCCNSSPSPPSPPSGDCYSICDRESDCTNYPSICGGCSFC